MHCYSHYNIRKEECQNCELRDYCKESTEDLPSLLSNRARKIPIEEIPKPLPIPKNYQHKEKKYSRRDMLELITFIVAMDEKTLEILAEKIQSPEISLADIGRKKNLTRQAIHKYIKNRCKEIPELAAVFNRQNEKTTTFMEAVCQIRQKSSERNSKKPELNSSSFRSLTSLHLSLDLSRLSIGKDLNF